MIKKIIFMLPNLNAGGAERVVSILSSKLCEYGYEVSICVFDKKNIAYSINEKVKIIQVPSKITKSNFLNKIYTYIAIKKLFTSNKNAIVIPFHGKCLKFALSCRKGTKIRVVACERNDPYSLYKNEKQKNLMKKLFSEADYCVFQTHDAQKFYKDYNVKYSIIKNPIMEPSLKWQGNIDKRRIITICRLTKQKNLQMAIDAMEIIRKDFGMNFNFDIYGQGELKTELIEYVKLKKLEKNVNFQGITQNVTKELINSSVFILTSDFEGLSNSMLEALSVGMPVICTDCPIGGAREVIRNNENGMLVSVGDANELANKIKMVLLDKDFAFYIASNAKFINEELSVKAIAEKWKEIIESI